MSVTQASAAPSGTGPLFSLFDPAQHSGPAVARAFQRGYALVLLLAWFSLASQVRLLIGSKGLLPASQLLERAQARGVSLFDMPTLFWLGHDDVWLARGAWLGVLLAVLALFGIAPRLCFALSAPLYLSYAVVGGDFLAFQWDNLLVESAVLAACLPADRPSRLAHFALRMLLFKLYFESGIAKWQSHLHDWQDGSAMRFYYETAPLPAGLAWHAHQLPELFHKLESWGALVLELVVPFLIWGPRRARKLAFFAFTGFQIMNTATANYGFFTFMSMSLHMFLLCDDEVASATATLRASLQQSRALTALRTLLRKKPRTSAPVEHDDSLPAIALGPLRYLNAFGAYAWLSAWLAASLIAGLVSFARPPRDGALVATHALFSELRVANPYHLFGHITRERIEPQFETLDDDGWHEHDLRFKPGNPERRPPYVAPHQPRVDFRLWFYGLSFQRGTPRYVSRLLRQLCDDPQNVQSLFVDPLPQAPQAVRIELMRYHFTTPEERARTGAYWKREPIGALPSRSCR